MVWCRPAWHAYAVRAIVTDQNGLLRAGVCGFPDGVFLVSRNVFRDGRRVAFDVVELKGLRRDHRAQCVPLAAIWINANFHNILLLVLKPDYAWRLRISAAIDAKNLAGDITGFLGHQKGAGRRAVLGLAHPPYRRCRNRLFDVAEIPALLRATQHRRVDEARWYRGHGDAVRSVLQCQRLGQPVDRGFGRDIVRHERGAGVRAGRGDVDDASPLGIQHVGQHGLDHVEDPVEVDVDQPLPIRELDMREALETVQPSGVDQHGDRAGLLVDARQRGVDLRAVGDIGGERQVCLGRFEVDGRDPETGFAEPLGDGQSDSGAATGDNSRFHVVTRLGTVSNTKNLPSEYENLTLTLWPRAR